MVWLEEQVSGDSSSPNKEFTSYSYVTGNHQEFRLGSELPWTDLRMKGTDLLWLGQSQEKGNYHWGSVRRKKPGHSNSWGHRFFFFLGDVVH